VNKVLIGNKCDWTDKRAVSQDEGRELANELGIKFIETSAKVNQGVEEAFFTLARCVNPDVPRLFFPLLMLLCLA
jgi:Ras-related protein Rab-8A